MSSEARLGLLERLAIKALQRLTIDGSGRLRVAAESVANMSTLTTCSTCTSVTNIANWGAGVTPTAFAQYQSQQAFQSGPRARIVKSA